MGAEIALLCFAALDISPIIYEISLDLALAGKGATEWRTGQVD